MGNDSIFLINAEGVLEKIPHTQYESEDLLQGLVENYPEIIVGDQIDPDKPPRWLLIKREVGIPDSEGSPDRWAIDHLLLDQSGKPTFVEVKRSSDTRIRREVVGQMLDYAANATIYWPTNRIRALAAEESGGLDKLDIRLSEFLNAEEDEEGSPDVESYWESVDRHLRNGEVRLLFIADSIPTELRRIIEFLNEHMPLVEVLGVEVRLYEGQNIRALVPRVIGQRVIPPRPTRKMTIEMFLNGCSGKSSRFFTDCFKFAKLEGYQVLFNLKGASFRIPSQSGRLITLFYGYPAGEEWPSTPLFQAYLGFVEDPEISNRLRQKVLSLAGFEQKGKHTLEVALTDEVVDALIPNLRETLKEAKQYFIPGD